MTQDRHNDNGNPGLLEQAEDAEVLRSVPTSPEVATRAKQRAKHEIPQNKFVIVAAGAIVTALLIFVAVSIPHRGGSQKTKSRIAVANNQSTTEITSEEKSLFPITDSGRPADNESHRGFLNERDLQRTAIRSGANASPTTQPNGAGTLGAIPPFGDKWQAPPYQQDSTASDTSDVSKAEREAMERPSLMYVRKVFASPSGAQTASEAIPKIGLGLAIGTRLRARLDSAASTSCSDPSSSSDRIQL